MAPNAEITWDSKTLRMVQAGGVYARVVRVDSALLCCFEYQRSCWVRRSDDQGLTWQSPVKAALFQYGNAANPELLWCQNGELLLFYNQRPSDHQHQFSIAMAASQDQGRTWQMRGAPLFTAGTKFGSGCYEPSAIQLRNGEIQLFFANELPRAKDGSQEITLLRSLDSAKSWLKPQAVSYRKGHRDGMPVPIVLLNGSGIAFAIEDNGVTPDSEFKPTIIHSQKALGWLTTPVGGSSSYRAAAVDPIWLKGLYAGAPYLRQMPSGLTLLSCQLSEDHRSPQMIVYIGDANARGFSHPSHPFGKNGKASQMWNSLFVKNADTVTAVSSTRVNGENGIWIIDGHVTLVTK